MNFTPLTKDQFSDLTDKGYSYDEIMSFEKKRKEDSVGYGEKVISGMKEIFPAITQKIGEQVQPMDIVSGMAPYKASAALKEGLLDTTLPPQLKSGIGRFAVDTATDPLTYAGASLIPKAAVKTGSALRSGAGISSESARWIKTRGAKNIFTPEKEAIDFIKTHLAPTVQKDVEKATTGAITKAEKAFATAEGKLASDTIVLKKSFNNAKEILGRYGLLDAAGRVLPSAKAEEVPRAIKIIAKMYEDALPAAHKIRGVGPSVNKAAFKFYRNMLRGVQSKSEGFSRDVQHVIEGLYDDMEKAGATGIKKAKDLFRKATQFEEEFGLTSNQIESKLASALDPKNTESIKRIIKPLLGKKTDAIFDAIKDHRVAQEFVMKGRPPWTKMGMLFGRPGRMVLKSMYESRYPIPLKK